MNFVCTRSCTCSGEDHPGPDVSVGRGAPEIDILEVEHNKTTDGTGQVVSQSAQFAPFTHDYLYVNDTADAWNIYTPDITKANGYRYVLCMKNEVEKVVDVGSFRVGDLQCKFDFDLVWMLWRLTEDGDGRQQAVSSLTNLPDEMFQTTSQTFRTLGD